MHRDFKTQNIFLSNGEIKTHEVAALTAINERLRDDYIADCQRGVHRWNKIIADAGIDFEIKLPHRGFHRQIGAFADIHVSPDGTVLDEKRWHSMRDEWLPTEADETYVKSLMTQVTEPGAFASWIAPPRIGVNNQPVDYPYVRM